MEMMSILTDLFIKRNEELIEGIKEEPKKTKSRGCICKFEKNLI